LPPIIAGVFILSLIYWLYLSLTTRMEIVYDSVEYEALGRIIQNKGLLTYFTVGLNREPLYPLLVASSMSLEHVTGLAFERIMAFYGVILMFVTQVLTYKVLRLLNIRTGICLSILAYLAMSPALNNAAFSLYSEIAALPVILGIILSSAFAWESVKEDKLLKAFNYGALLGILLTAATLIKAVFECIAPVNLIILFAALYFTEIKKGSKKIITFLLCFAAAAGFFYAPITAYKCINLHYNGKFAITNRGSWALYGSTARRMEPLTPKKFAEALAFAPGEGVCNGLFGQQECDFWSFHRSDGLGFAKAMELDNQHLSAEKINATLLRLSAQEALHNPLQYGVLTIVEGLKMFFWESTQVGFVNYPHWLQKIYDIKIFNNALRFFTFIATFIAVITLWFQNQTSQRSPISFLMGVLIFLYILFFSFFFILTRYALPIVPLYLICIGIWLNQKR